MTGIDLSTQDPRVASGSPRSVPSVLVAGIGNIFFSDDAFGVEVVDRLLRRPVPAGVKVVDFGIRGLHLAHELLDGYDVLVLVDVMALDDAPGTVALVEIGERSEPGARPDGLVDTPPALDAHSISPEVVLGALGHLGGSIDRVLVVGCQPETCASGMGLSPTVAAAVAVAVDTVDRLLVDLSSRTERSEYTP